MAQGSFFENKKRYDPPQGQDSENTASRNPRCKYGIGLIVSFLVLSASVEVLLVSSLNKTVIPYGGDAINDFLTTPLSKNYEHFANGSALGMGGAVLSLMALIYFIHKLYNSKRISHPQSNISTFIDSGLFEFNGNPLYRAQNFYEANNIVPQSHTLAAFILHEKKPIYVGIPQIKYQENVICSDFFDQEIERLKKEGKLPKECEFDRFVKVPIGKCMNLTETAEIISVAANHEKSKEVLYT